MSQGETAGTPEEVERFHPISTDGRRPVKVHFAGDTGYGAATYQRPGEDGCRDVEFFPLTASGSPREHVGTIRGSGNLWRAFADGVGLIWCAYNNSTYFDTEGSALCTLLYALKPRTRRRRRNADRKSDMPKRIQRKRTRGWRMPDGCVYVGRPSAWGNPFAVGDYYASRTWAHNRPDPRGDRGEPGTYHHEGMTFGPWTETIGVVRDRAHAVELFRAYIAYEDIVWEPDFIRQHLAGRDLACWCPLVDADGNRVPCHADVLLRIANGG